MTVRIDSGALLGGISLLLLGEVGVVVDGDLRRLPGQRQRAVLAYLTLRASRTVGWDQLGDAPWDERLWVLLLALDLNPGPRPSPTLDVGSAGRPSSGTTAS